MRKSELVALGLLPGLLLVALMAIAYLRLAPINWPHASALNERFPVMRKSHEGIRSLSGVDLAHSDLSEAQWRGAEVMGCDLRWSNLRGANLRDVYFGALMVARGDPPRSAWFETDLRCADLTGADLRGARFDACRIEGAVFTGALYDDRTAWPTGFDPRAAGAVALPRAAK